MSEDVTLEEAQSYIDGIAVARIITEWSTTIGKEYGKETRHALSAVGPIQGMIGLAIKNKNLFLIDDQELLDSRDPEHSSYGITGAIHEERYKDNITVNRKREEYLEEKLADAKHKLVFHRYWFVATIAVPIVARFFDLWSFNF